MEKVCSIEMQCFKDTLVNFEGVHQPQTSLVSGGRWIAPQCHRF